MNRRNPNAIDPTAATAKVGAVDRKNISKSAIVLTQCDVFMFSNRTIVLEHNLKKRTTKSLTLSTSSATNVIQLKASQPLKYI